LLGMLKDKDGFVARIFHDFNIDAKAVSEAILHELDPNRKRSDDK